MSVSERSLIKKTGDFGRVIKYEHNPILWNRDARDLDGLSDRELLEELCQRVVDYHASSLKFHDCERGTLDDVLDNDNN